MEKTTDNNNDSKSFNKVWICNECDMPNFTQSVLQSDVEQGLVSCIDCGCTEFHLETVISLNK